MHRLPDQKIDTLWESISEKISIKKRRRARLRTAALSATLAIAIGAIAPQFTTPQPRQQTSMDSEIFQVVDYFYGSRAEEVQILDESNSSYFFDSFYKE